MVGSAIGVALVLGFYNLFRWYFDSKNNSSEHKRIMDMIEAEAKERIRGEAELAAKIGAQNEALLTKLDEIHQAIAKTNQDLSEAISKTNEQIASVKTDVEWLKKQKG